MEDSRPDDREQQGGRSRPVWPSCSAPNGFEAIGRHARVWWPLLSVSSRDTDASCRREAGWLSRAMYLLRTSIIIIHPDPCMQRRSTTKLLFFGTAVGVNASGNMLTANRISSQPRSSILSYITRQPS